MRQKQKIQMDHERQKSEEAMHYAEDRMQLLETIRQMIDSEMDRREHSKHTYVHSANPPPFRCKLWELLVSSLRSSNK